MRVYVNQSQVGPEFLPAPAPPNTPNPGFGFVNVTVVNSIDVELPLTGGAGTLLFTVLGLVLIGGSVLLLITNRKRQK